MQRIPQRALAFAASPAAYALYLLVLCLSAYGPFLPWLGFYWDDFPMSWIAHSMGNAGMARYFSTNRPVWGLIYQLTTPVLGSVPLRWQIFALLLRWVSGLAFWLLLRQLWPRRRQLAAWSAALFVVYPGFSQQFISFVYSHFFIILSLFLLSFSLMIIALRSPQRYQLLTVGALLASLVNLLSMEYFFLFELMRPLLAWMVLGETIPDRRARLVRALRVWLPYLAIFLGVVIWRSFFFGFHTYQPTLVGQLKTQPLQTIQVLTGTVLHDIVLTTLGALSNAFQIPSSQTRLFAPARYWWVVYFTGLVSALFLMAYQSREKQRQHLWALQPLGVAILALLIAGGPFWLTGLQIGLSFGSDRFTLPFMFGFSLALASLLCLIPVLPNSFKASLLAAVLAFSAGAQFQNAALYRQDWNTQRDLFWQMRWRIPALQAGTLLLSNELPVLHYTDNSLSAPLNWIYDSQHIAQNRQPAGMDYLLYYPTLRTDPWLTNPQKGILIQRDYLAATFKGSTDQVVVFYFNPPGCLRVLDPEIETTNWMVPAYLRNMLQLSSTAPIIVSPSKTQAARLPAQLYGSEPAASWCSYFEKADLARQAGEWETVAKLGDQAFSSGDYPNDPAERLPFIEGYAHVGNWERALALSRETSKISKVMQPGLCSLWGRIERQMPASPQLQNAQQTIRTEMECGPGK